MSIPITPNMFKDVPGTVTVEIIAFDAGDPQYQTKLPDGRVVDEGLSLAEWRKRFGGDEGVTVDPAVGQTHHISLKPWANADPNKTHIRIGFHFIPKQPIPPQHQHLFPPPPWKK